MKPSIIYRASAVVLLLFAAGHQVGFRQVDPRWNAGLVIDAMHAVRFPVQGVIRSYWDFFSGFGFFVTTLLVFSAWLAWSVAGLTPEVRRALTPVLWGFGAAFAVIALLAWSYFFVAAGIFATVAAVLLLLGAASVSMESAS